MVVIHEAYGLNDNIRDITGRFAAEGYAALAVDLFNDRSRVICMARLLGEAMIGREPFAVPHLRASADFLIAQPEVDGARLGVIGFCMGGGLALAWGCRDRRLRAIAPFYAMNPRPRSAARRLCPVVGSYPGRDITARGGRKLETRLETYGIVARHQDLSRSSPFVLQRPGQGPRPGGLGRRLERTLVFFAEHVGSEPALPVARTP